MSNAGLAEPLGFIRAGQKPDAAEQASINSRVSRLLNGQRPIAWGQLTALARHAGLNGFLGSAEEAARHLDDDVSLHVFTRRLFETRWAHPDYAERALFGTRRPLLVAFARFPMRREGLTVGTGLAVMAARPGRTRSSRLPQQDDALAQAQRALLAGKAGGGGWTHFLFWAAPVLSGNRLPWSR